MRFFRFLQKLHVQVGRRTATSYHKRLLVTDSVKNAVDCLVTGGFTTPCFLQVSKFLDRIAVVDGHGSHTYEDISYLMNSLTDRLCDELNASKDDSKGERVCILCPNDVSYVVAQLSVWMSGSIAVPLSDKHPPAQLEYFIQDSQCRIVVSSIHFVDILKPITDRLGVSLLIVETADCNSTSNNVSKNQLPDRWSNRINRLQQLRDGNQFKNRKALIVYTSGTTGQPKVSM